MKIFYHSSLYGTDESEDGHVLWLMREARNRVRHSEWKKTLVSVDDPSFATRDLSQEKN